MFSAVGVDREQAIAAGLIRPILMEITDPNYHRCGRKKPYATVSDAYAIAARLSESSPDGKKICIYPCRWMHPGCFHIGNRTLRTIEVVSKYRNLQERHIKLTQLLKQTQNELLQSREAKKGWMHLANAYLDSIKAYPIANSLLRRLGIQIGTVVEKGKT